MNPVITAQAHQLAAYLKANEDTKAHLFLEQTHLPYDVQDLIFAALSSLPKLNDDIIEQILEAYATDTSFDERILH